METNCMSSTTAGVEASEKGADAAMAPYRAPGAMTRPNTRWSLNQRGSVGASSVSNSVSPRGESWRTPRRGWPAALRRCLGASAQ
ncbi:MAG: hypothetical protein OXI25_05135 [Chloroflexota bacterium]|nr:hypothetical protein [Chloroflexota bacterium]